jgi:glycosyltransferase involved in cell wall biosynthesis
MNICVVIPTYNESKAISGVVSAIKNLGLQVVVIDDGSLDATAVLAAKEGAVVLRNLVNQGKGACLIKGFNYALENKFDCVITMDGDGQHLPEDLSGFIRKADDPSADIIVGNRMFDTKDMPFVRILTNKFMSWLISLICRQKIPDTQCGYRLIKRIVLEKVELKTVKFEAESEILVKASRMGFKISSVPIKTVYGGQKSQINPLIDTLRFLRFLIKGLWIMQY